MGQGAAVQAETVRIALDGRGVAWVAWTEVTASSAQVIVRADGLPVGEDVARVAASAQAPSSLGAVVLAVGILGVAAAAAVWVWRRPR